MDDGIDCVVPGNFYSSGDNEIREYEASRVSFHQRYRDISQLRSGMSLITVPVSYVELIQIPRLFE